MMPAVSHRQDQTLARALESEGNAEIPENPSKVPGNFLGLILTAKMMTAKVMPYLSFYLYLSGLL